MGWKKSKVKSISQFRLRDQKSADICRFCVISYYQGDSWRRCLEISNWRIQVKRTAIVQKMRKTHVTWWLKRWSACRHSISRRKRNILIFLQPKNQLECNRLTFFVKIYEFLSGCLSKSTFRQKYYSHEVSASPCNFLFKKNWWHSFMAHRRRAHIVVYCYTKTCVILLQRSIGKFEANSIDSNTLMWNKFNKM